MRTKPCYVPAPGGADCTLQQKKVVEDDRKKGEEQDNRSSWLTCKPKIQASRNSKSGQSSVLGTASEVCIPVSVLLGIRERRLGLEGIFLRLSDRRRGLPHLTVNPG